MTSTTMANYILASCLLLLQPAVSRSRSRSLSFIYHTSDIANCYPSNPTQTPIKSLGNVLFLWTPQPSPPPSQFIGSFKCENDRSSSVGSGCSTVGRTTGAGGGVFVMVKWLVALLARLTMSWKNVGVRCWLQNWKGVQWVGKSTCIDWQIPTWFPTIFILGLRYDFHHSYTHTLTYTLTHTRAHTHTAA